MVKNLGFAIFLFASFGCSLLSKIDNDSNRRFVVDAKWVQDSLKKENAGFRKINRMSPVVHKNTVVVGNAYDGLVAYDLETKNQKWRLNIPYGVEASGAVAGDYLFVGGNNGKMYSVDLGTGEIVWVFETKSELVSEPLLHKGVLYFISGSQSLYAVDAGTGKQVWIHNRQDTSNSMTVRGGAKPAIDGETLFAGFSDGSLVAVSAKSGAELWEVILNRNSRFKDIDADPVVDGDFIFINSYDDKIYCLSKNKGEIIWSAPVGGAGVPLVANDFVYVSSSQGDVVALSKKDGTEVWRKTTKLGVFTPPGLFENLLITGESQGKVLFLDKETGSTVGSFEPGRGVFSKPTVYRDSVYFISGEGNVYGLSARFEHKASIYYLK